jgi:signal transduction histidine kinase
VPITVNGRLWGFIAIGSGTGRLAPDAEARLAEFTELTAAAIATAQSRAELIASRARIVAASDEARERIERDLHDGAQQQLVTLSLQLSTLALCPDVSDPVRAELTKLSNGLQTVIAELREMARGIHPAILSEAGLPAALRALASRSALPVRVRAHVPARLPPPVEVGAYYVVSEALTNAVKHSRAKYLWVDAALENAVLRVRVADDGIGGAATGEGSGLAGLRDRVEALGGWLSIDSPAGTGTRISCEIPAG